MNFCITQMYDVKFVSSMIVVRADKLKCKLDVTVVHVYSTTMHHLCVFTVVKIFNRL